MTVINGLTLLVQSPIKNMADEKTNEYGVSSGLSEVGYDIRLKQSVTFTPLENGDCLTVVDDPNEGPDYTEGNFVLASAMEEFDMPTDLMGIVHDKSTWARQGLSVFNTVIEPGWKGFLTLELVYHGRKALHIPAGSGIAQVVFHRTCEPAQYQGKYQNQADKPVEAVFVK